MGKEFVDINVGEGLCEYIRRVEGLKKESSELMGISNKYFGNNQNSRINIIGNEKFIEKFKRRLLDYDKE